MRASTRMTNNSPTFRLTCAVPSLRSETPPRAQTRTTPPKRSGGGLDRRRGTRLVGARQRWTAVVFEDVVDGEDLGGGLVAVVAVAVVVVVVRGPRARPSRRPQTDGFEQRAELGGVQGVPRPRRRSPSGVRGDLPPGHRLRANRRDGEEERQEEPGRERARDAHFAGRRGDGGVRGRVRGEVRARGAVREREVFNAANKHNNITPDTALHDLHFYITKTLIATLWRRRKTTSLF